MEADVCIIGGGPAGISIAKRLIGSGLQVLLLVGGGREESAADRDLHRGVIPVQGNHEPLEENRRRQFGGASTVWGGRCLALDPIDFEVRPWVEHSGWPITYKELEPYYAQALHLCEAGEACFDARQAFPSESKEIIANMDNRDLASWPMERWSPPTNFATAYERELDQAANVRVCLDSHVCALVSDNSSAEISQAHVVRSGRRFSVRAKIFVLAAGGIENARLLLASRGNLHPHGIGNTYDLVGRYYMCHLNGTYALLNPAHRKQILYPFKRDQAGVYTRRRWWITAEAQRSRKIGNMIFCLYRTLDSHGHRDALFSAVYLAKATLALLRARSMRDRRALWASARTGAREHLGTVFASGFKLAPELLSQLRLRYASGRRLPSVLPSLKEPYLGLYFQAEHMPNPESRVTLSSDETDAHGVPRAVVKVSFSDLDIHSVLEGHRIFMDRYALAEAGEATFDEKELKDYVLSRCRNFNSGAHHLGTTRMSDWAELGVVDSECRVHGTGNLYLAGSSVFPTGGHVNPTLTIVALALRVADHIRSVSDQLQKVEQVLAEPLRTR